MKNGVCINRTAKLIVGCYKQDGELPNLWNMVEQARARCYTDYGFMPEKDVMVNAVLKAATKFNLHLIAARYIEGEMYRSDVL